METCRERLKREHPLLVNFLFVGGCLGCPHSYGYASKSYYCCFNGILAAIRACRACWDRPAEVLDAASYVVFPPDENNKPMEVKDGNMP